nr:glycerol-3-phosphate 1-O-acyltransferase PlsY [Roseomonas acroporae]
MPTLLLGYLLGSIPFGLLLTRAAGLGDIRKVGSGNIGATNVLRTGRKGLAAATLLLDALKGAVAVWLGGAGGAMVLPGALLGGTMAWGATPWLGLVAGFGAMLGHAFPVWLGFKGGKGVATALGVLLAASWWLGLAAAAAWLLVAFTTRLSSLAAMVACAVTPVLALLGGWKLALFALLVALLVVYRHQGNIRRLLAGTEPRIGRGA